MKTLADFKRRLTPGSAVTVIFPGFVIRGNLGDTEIPSRIVTRRVHSVTPSAVVWEKEGENGKPGSRLYWPKADCLTFGLDGNTVAVSDEPGKNPFATYQFQG